MLCGKCGNEIKDGEKFCGKCGNIVNENEKEKTKKNRNKILYIIIGFMIIGIIVSSIIFILKINNKLSLY